MMELPRHSLIIGARNRFYYVIPMPIDENGMGPVEWIDAVRVEWEVWDQLLNSHGSFSFLADAIDEAERLNVEHDEWEHKDD